MSGVISWMRRTRALINIKKEEKGIGRRRRRNWGKEGGTEESKQGRDKVVRSLLYTECISTAGPGFRSNGKQKCKAFYLDISLCP